MESVVEYSLISHIQNVIDKIAKSENYQDYKIVTSGFGKGENHLGIIKRIKILGTTVDGNEKTTALVLKAPPDNSNIRKHIFINEYYSREVIAYKVFLLEVQNLNKKFFSSNCTLNFAKCHHADSTDLKEFLLLEDLNAKGYIMFDRLQLLNYDQVVFIIKQMAHFHALSFTLKEKHPEIYDSMYDVLKKQNYGPNFAGIMQSFAESTLRILDNPEHKRRLADFAVNICDKLHKYLVVNETDIGNIVCHGDCWNNNFLFKFEDDRPVEMVMLDWQMIKYASPVTDLSYFIFCSTDQMLRKQYLEDIFNIYYDTLKCQLKKLQCDVTKCYPEEIYRKHLKEKLPYGLIKCLLCIPLTMGEREYSIDLADITEVDKINVGKLQMSERCVKRLRDIVSDFVEYKMI